MLFAFVLAAEPAWALQCAADSTAPTSAMFRGEVISVVEGKPWLDRVVDKLRAWISPYRRFLARPSGTYVVTFNVKSSWMGVTTRSVSVTTPGYGGIFAVGREYLVYAHGSLDDLHADSCSRTREFFGTNDEYLDTLPELPLTRGSVLETLPTGALVAAVALALLVVFWELRRRRV